MAGRYATALFELALEEKAIDAVKKDLEQFDALIAANPDLARLVRSPVFGADFLRVITANRRLFAVRDMIRGFRTLVARHRGEVTAQITAAEKLNDTHLEALKSALKSVTGGKNIDLDVKVEPAIIGGLIVKVGSRMIDSSLRTKLNAIKFAMKEAR
jgi:F-type H+-transporting ATPase subunit delta